MPHREFIPVWLAAPPDGYGPGWRIYARSWSFFLDEPFPSKRAAEDEARLLQACYEQAHDATTAQCE